MHVSQEHFVSQKKVVELTTLSGASIYRKVKEGHFPKPFYISPRRKVWTMNSILQWMEDRKNGIPDNITDRDAVDRHVFDGLSTRAANALRNHGIKCRAQAIELTDGDILRMPNCGRNTLREIRAWQRGIAD